MDNGLLRQARDASDRLARSQQTIDDARTDYHQAIRRLHLAGASLREVAEALDLSYQRVHQIIEATGGTPDWRHRRRTADLACSFCGQSSAAGLLAAGAAPSSTASAAPSSTAGAAPALAAGGSGGLICGSCVDFCDEAVAATSGA